ncbi:tetraspanin Tsp2 [Ephemerocybe angulata]|uniref:Tetraspanin Tsp2 n=1 Tax=Ephemerocybe angulata TaxID=980116 RepID=A0A8H6LUK9_9AGAR|nr:tetraspanin Tsp2 [Tulosesus angulatus]
MLADFNADVSSSHSPSNSGSHPSPLHLHVPQYAGISSGLSSGLSSPTSTSGLSLSVNYLPAKFSDNILNARARLRGKGGGGEKGPSVPKQGGGLAAFKSGEARIGGKSLRWTRFKVILFIANLLLSLYSLVAMIACLLTWFATWQHADIIRVANNPELVLSTLAASLGMLTSVIGWAGILLNNRTFLAVYTLLTWVTFAFLVTPGYITYRRYSLNLEGKINDMWANALGAMGRMRIQNQLSCCGYFSPYVEATVSQTCYARSILPGCKKAVWDYEERILRNWWKTSFALVPVHICVMLAALMCSNHVTYRFGKGMMPEAYRLNVGSMAVIMDQYANQLAEQYGPEVAGKVLEQSKSNLGLTQTGR